MSMMWPMFVKEPTYNEELSILGDTLQEIEAADTDYPERYKRILYAMYWAAAAGLKTGYRIDPAEPEWPVAYIELPTGQVSWHMPQFPEQYDGHSTEEKYRRVHAFLEEH